ncbi:MAG: Gfo/Idh/MocA family oxidoreductase [Bryobacteraceae bacterium]
MSQAIKRRTFLTAAGLAAAQDKPLGVAAIGVGNRGFFLLKEFQNLPGVEVRVICDLYDGNLRRAKEFSKNTRAAYTKKWEEAIAAPGVDAVVIATPDFWHAPMALAAARARKDIYLEKPLCMTVAEAKQLRAAVRENKVVLQLGHNRNSAAPLFKAREIYRSGKLGAVPLIRTYIDRAHARPPWKFYTDAQVLEMPKDASPQTIDWDRFLGGKAKRPFDAEQFFRWRGWWEFSTGVAGDLMSHLWDSVNMIAGMGIPRTCMTHGALYFWKNEIHVPDMWHAVFDYPNRELTVTFNQAFHNSHYGDVVQVLGREGTMEAGPAFCRVWGPEWRERQKAPNYVFKPGELEVSSHWQDFVDSIRTRATPRCGIDRAFEEAVTIAMSIEAYRRRREVRWDANKEEIV